MPGGAPVLGLCVSLIRPSSLATYVRLWGLSQPKPCCTYTYANNATGSRTGSIGLDDSPKPMFGMMGRLAPSSACSTCHHAFPAVSPLPEHRLSTPMLQRARLPSAFHWLTGALFLKARIQQGTPACRYVLRRAVVIDALQSSCAQKDL